ncbi:MAG: hypothetical protein ACH350_05990 [Parachlamydiaceae bacterium]
MINQISQSFKSYYNDLPDHITRSILKSGALTFTLTVMCADKSNGMVNFENALVYAGLAALASTIHALTTPLFNYLLEKSDTSKPINETIKSTFVSATVSLLWGLRNPASFTLNAVAWRSFLSLNSITAWMKCYLDPNHHQIKDNSTYMILL